MILIIRYQDLNQMIFVLLVVAQVVVLLLLLLDHVQCKYSFFFMYNDKIDFIIQVLM